MMCWKNPVEGCCRKFGRFSFFNSVYTYGLRSRGHYNLLQKLFCPCKYNYTNLCLVKLETLGNFLYQPGKIYNSNFPHIFSLPLDCKQPVCGLWHTWFFKISVILQPPIWSCFSILNFVSARVWNHEVVEFIWAESNHTTLGLMISQWHSMALVLLHHQVLSTFNFSQWIKILHVVKY